MTKRNPNAKQYGTRIPRECLTCGSKFFMRPSETTNRRDDTPRKYCSRKCAQEGRKVPIQDRFWNHVTILGSNDCWPWNGTRDPEWGYGGVRVEDRIERSHRVAFFLTHGYWPKVCRHSCDNPPCCNPAHLLDGTHADNAADKVARGRARGGFGEGHASAKLSCDKVLVIRSLVAKGQTQQEVAIQFGIIQTTVSKIARGKIWRHC